MGAHSVPAEASGESSRVSPLVLPLLQWDQVRPRFQGRIPSATRPGLQLLCKAAAASPSSPLLWGRSPLGAAAGTEQVTEACLTWKEPLVLLDRLQQRLELHPDGRGQLLGHSL